MQEALSTGIDFYLSSNRENPFQLHLITNHISHNLVQLRLQCYILNKLSLLPLAQKYELLLLYKKCLEDVIENPQMKFQHRDVVQQLIQYVEVYWKSLQIRGGKTSQVWPRIRAAFMVIEEKIPKNADQSIKQLIIFRRGILQPDKGYFLSQMMGKKIQTQSLKNFIASLKARKNEKEDVKLTKKQNLHSQIFQVSTLTSKNAKKIIIEKLRVLSLMENKEAWVFLSQLQQNILFEKLDQEDKNFTKQYIEDIIQSYKNVTFQISLKENLLTENQILERQKICGKYLYEFSLFK